MSMSYWNPFREKSQAASAEGERCGAVDDDWLECALPLGHEGPHSDRASGEGGERWMIYVHRETGKVRAKDANALTDPLALYEPVEVCRATALTAAEKDRDELQRQVWSIEDEVIRPYNAALEVRAAEAEARADSLATQLERSRAFLKRAEQALVGIGGAESYDEDKIDEARSLIMAAWGSLTDKDSE